ncbi:lycopene cyclase domain-containing protein [Arthrobacter sp. I2-34]|uniref:Lycopene cyclase domain-containing protein n=1 Tax=Arthrobacter hankyongi TaxID=2904801 RepID=A0ABS9LEH0_9MICC|nr:lycopene cyclase domain-containing protein [Arthrobacter hankyongi]MCG2624854.1 lycopene cyclase domain-containing protein [Arthrobacter hankyongi]
MTPLVYLGCLAVSLAGMAVLDWRLVLFFRAAPVRAGIVLAAGLAFFLVWDLSGIALGIFHRGRSEYMTGIMLAPELPLEEVFFLAFLCYLAMNLYRLLSRRLRTGSFVPPAARAPAARTGNR